MGNYEEVYFMYCKTVQVEPTKIDVYSLCKRLNLQTKNLG